MCSLRASEGNIKHTFCRTKTLIAVANASTGDSDSPLSADASPCVILKAIRTGAGWVWLAMIARFPRVKGQTVVAVLDC